MNQNSEESKGGAKGFRYYAYKSVDREFLNELIGAYIAAAPLLAQYHKDAPAFAMLRSCINKAIEHDYLDEIVGVHEEEHRIVYDARELPRGDREDIIRAWELLGNLMGQRESQQEPIVALNKAILALRISFQDIPRTEG